MAQKEIEMILTRQLASYLAMPIFLVDAQGNLIFYNEPAEAILGRRFEETGEMSVAEWSTAFSPTDDAGISIPSEGLPLVKAVTERKPAHRSIWLKGLDNVRRHVEVTAFPLIGQEKRNLGAVAILWELRE